MGLRGARTAAEVVDPDIAIALDVSLRCEHPGKPRKEVEERFENGAAILIHDRTMIPNTRLRDFVIGLADDLRIPYYLTSVRGGYDTGEVHVHRTGVPSVVVGWPTRYIHVHAGILAAEDYDAAVDLVVAFIERFDEAAAGSIRFS